jgi:uncharacterized membrane protein YbhN (UPF0104 family)
VKLRIGWPLRLAVSAALLTALLLLLPADKIWTGMRRVDGALWGLALAGFLAGHAVSAVKWRTLASLDGEVGWGGALRAHFAGLAANLCLPGVAGGDVVRAAWLMRGSERKARIAIGSVVDRLVDCAALVVLALIGAAWAANADASVGTILATTAAVLGGGTLVALAGAWFVARRAGNGVAQKLALAAGELTRRPTRLALCCVLSLVVQGSFVALNAMIGAACGLNVEFAGWLTAWPLAKLVATMPISLAGLGVRESSLAAFLKPFGGAPELAIASSLVWWTILMAGGLIGAAVIGLSRARATQPPLRTEEVTA